MNQTSVNQADIDQKHSENRNPAPDAENTTASNHTSAEVIPLKPAKKGGLKPKDIHEFLPAALEVEQTPASPIGRTLIWVIAALFVLAVFWACFGKVDIVAVATGKVITSERVKEIQPLETGTISEILVKEGQHVKAGDPLIRFDHTTHTADVVRTLSELNERRLESSRMATYEQWLSSDRSRKPVLRASQPTIEYASLHLAPQANTLSRQQQLLDQQVAELSSRLSNLHSEQSRLLAEQDMTRAEIEKQQRVIPVLKQRVDALDSLQKRQYGSKLQYLELKQELIEEEQDQSVQQARLMQLQASTQAVSSQLDALVYEQRKNNLTEKQQTDLQIQALEQELIKTQQRLKQQQLIAPIDGQVQQLAVHTLGGVVTPAQVLMLIVPKDSQLEVEAKVLNKDIGFVAEGQKAAVKIDTFNFTKYGLIDGEIINISDDAIQDEELGLVYNARIKLNEEKIQVENKWVRLSPGMSVTSEIKTGQRRLIEYFLSPLLRYRQESIRER